MPPSTRGRLLAVSCVALGLLLVTVAVGGMVTAGAFGASADRAGAPAAPPQPADDVELPERMDVQGEITDGTTVVGLDVGGAIQHDSSRLVGAFERSHLEERLALAENASQRESILAAEYAEANATFRTLRQRERSALERYRSGRIGAPELLAELRTVHVRASEQSRMLSLVRSRSDSVNDSLASRAMTLDSQYVARQGSLRAELGAIAAGEQTPRRFYVATGTNGVAVARVGQDQFAREVHRDDLFVRGESPRMDFDALLGHLRELYPSIDSFQQLVGPSPHVFSMGSDHDNGRIESYLDSHSQDVFREYQTLDLDDDLPTTSAGVASSGSLRMEVNRTYPSGPALVEVTESVQRTASPSNSTATDDSTDSATNATTVREPVEGAPVTVDGTVVARTDENGRAWVVLPYGQPEVTTSHEDRELSLVVDWSGDTADTTP